MRCFVAIDLPETLRERFVALQSQLPKTPNVRPVDPDNAHLTLKFLGEVDGTEAREKEITAAIETAVETAAVGPFDCSIGGVGVFPSLEYISVIWTGVENAVAAERLSRLHAAIEQETTAIGVQPNEREFTPHVTLARMSDPRGKSAVQALQGSDVSVGSFRVKQIKLKESVVTDSGPVYETRESVAL